jgi:hypothetical protein
MSLAIAPLSSFPQTRESRLAAISLVESLDSRVCGNDEIEGEFFQAFVSQRKT